MIGFDKTTSEGSKFIRVSPETAISNDRFVTKLETGVGENGNAWLQCTVTDSAGATANKRWFEPSMGGYIDDAEKLKKAEDKTLKIIMNLVRRFKGNEVSIKGVNYKEFFDSAVAAVQSVPNWDKKPLQILVVNGKPTDDGAVFPTLPNFPPIFAENNAPVGTLRITEYHDVKAWEPSGVTPDEDITVASDNSEVTF